MQHDVSVRNDHEPCKNGGTATDATWRVDLCGLKKPLLDGGTYGLNNLCSEVIMSQLLYRHDIITIKEKLPCTDKIRWLLKPSVM